MKHRIVHDTTFFQAIEIAEWFIERGIRSNRAPEYWEAIRAGAEAGLTTPVPIPGMSQDALRIHLEIVFDNPKDAVEFKLRFVG